MVLHDADGFLTQLTRMLERSREKGAVYVTMKRCECPPGEKKPFRPLVPPCHKRAFAAAPSIRPLHTC